MHLPQRDILTQALAPTHTVDCHTDEVINTLKELIGKKTDNNIQTFVNKC